MDIWYRAKATTNPHTFKSSERISIWFEEYRVLRHTPKGAWLDTHIGKKFVLKRGNKVFARANKDDAVSDLRHRYNRRIQILHSQLDHTKDTLKHLSFDT